MRISPKYNTFWRRVGAAFIDDIILSPLAWLSAWVNGMDGPMIALVLVIVVSQCGKWIYNVLMHGACGQTVGKMAMGIKVLDLDEGPITMSRAFLRESFYVVVNVITVAIYIKRRLGTIQDPGAVERIEAFIALAAALWSLLEIGTTLFNDKRRALHDYIGGTVVVRTKYVTEQQTLVQLLEDIKTQPVQAQVASATTNSKSTVGRSAELR
ncbi:MAG TPA: RDD family protein [Blastocatellia bacterium]|nr:RDD family protein [Blastocatellia bacterium]